MAKKVTINASTLCTGLLAVMSTIAPPKAKALNNQNNISVVLIRSVNYR